MAITRTAIDGSDKITYCNSPVYLRFSQTDIVSAKVYLWVWYGAQNKTLGDANQVLQKDLVHPDDTYISFEISNILRAYLQNAGGINQPNFAYNEIGLPAITGQGIFWQIQAEITDKDNVTTLYNYNTQFATLGYQKTFDTFEDQQTKYYNSKIHDYFVQDFDFTKTVSEATSGNIISITPVTPDNNICTDVPYMIAYLDSKGLFQLFTPYGKVVVSDKIDDSVRSTIYRDEVNVNYNYQHTKERTITDIIETYTINTGLLTQEMVSVVRDIVISPKVYLIKFKGDTQTTTTVGITIDNTFITVDSINTTIDGLSVGEEYLTFYKTHTQIPVILKDTDFTFKNRRNDKSSIDYTLKFEQTKSVIL